MWLEQEDLAEELMALTASCEFWFLEHAHDASAGASLGHSV